MALVVYDAGALVAGQRMQSRFMGLHRTFAREHREILVPLSVYVQVYRDDPRQHGLHMLMKSATLHYGDKTVADLAGRALRLTGTSDPVDAIVAATAVVLRAPVVTSDPADISRLISAVATSKVSVWTV